MRHRLRRWYRRNNADIVAYAFYALTFIALFLLVLTFGCKSVAPAVLTQDRSGDPMVQVDIPAAGDRGEIPMGVDAGDVVAQVHTDSGSTIVIAKTPKRSLTDKVLGKRKYTAYLDNKAVSEAKVVSVRGDDMVSQPRAPWWKWPIYFLVAVIGALFLYFMRPLCEMVKEVVSIANRFRK